MYAIIKTGGKQYRVSEGDVVYIEKLDVQPEETVNFEEVIRVFSGDSFLLSATVRGMIYYFFSTFVGMPINLFVAYLLYKKITGAEFFRTVLFVSARDMVRLRNF